RRHTRLQGDWSSDVCSSDLFFGSLILSFLFGAFNVAVALRVRGGPALRAVGIKRRTLWSGAGAVGLSSAAVISLIISGGVGSRWNELALFMHRTDTGVREPVFNLDASFYLLTLPFLHDVQGWFAGLVFLVLLLITGLYAWRGDTFDLRLPPRAVAHLSILLGAFALVLAVGAFLGRYDLLFAHNGAVWGAGYTDVNARTGLAVLQAVLAVLLAIALFANAVLRRPAVLVGTVVTWLVAFVLFGIYPAFVQRVIVQPAELSQESPYLSREIGFTRRAFAVDRVD